MTPYLHIGGKQHLSVHSILVALDFHFCPPSVKQKSCGISWLMDFGSNHNSCSPMWSPKDTVLILQHVVLLGPDVQWRTHFSKPLIGLQDMAHPQLKSTELYVGSLSSGCRHATVQCSHTFFQIWHESLNLSSSWETDSGFNVDVSLSLRSVLIHANLFLFIYSVSKRAPEDDIKLTPSTCSNGSI